MNGDDAIVSEMNRIWVNLLCGSDIRSDYELGMAFQLYLDTGLLDTGYDDRLAAICALLKDYGLRLRDCAESSDPSVISSEFQRIRMTWRYSEYAISFMESNLQRVFKKGVPIKKASKPKNQPTKPVNPVGPTPVETTSKKEQMVIEGTMFGFGDGYIFSYLKERGNVTIIRTAVPSRDMERFVARNAEKIRFSKNLLFILMDGKMSVMTTDFVKISSFGSHIRDFELDSKGTLYFTDDYWVSKSVLPYSSSTIYSKDDYNILVGAYDEVILKNHKNGRLKRSNNVIRDDHNSFFTWHSDGKACSIGNYLYLSDTYLMYIDYTVGTSSSKMMSVQEMLPYGDFLIAAIQSEWSVKVVTIPKGTLNTNEIGSFDQVDAMVLNGNELLVQSGIKVNTIVLR